MTKNAQTLWSISLMRAWTSKMSLSFGLSQTGGVNAGASADYKTHNPTRSSTLLMTL